MSHVKFLFLLNHHFNIIYSGIFIQSDRHNKDILKCKGNNFFFFYASELRQFVFTMMLRFTAMKQKMSTQFILNLNNNNSSTMLFKRWYNIYILSKSSEEFKYRQNQTNHELLPSINYTPTLITSSEKKKRTRTIQVAFGKVNWKCSGVKESIVKHRGQTRNIATMDPLQIFQSF